MLEVKHLSVQYHMKEQTVYAVTDVSFKLEKGGSLGIIGESGSGKSTLALAILRMHNPKTTSVTGEILYHGLNLLPISEAEYKKYRWKIISAVFQKSMNNLSPVHRIGTQFEDIYRVHYPGAKRSKIKDTVVQLLEAVNLSPRIYTLYPHELSGGMLQRVSIALGLLFKPQLIIMDEATTALDVITQGQILEEIKELELISNVSRIMITHDLSVVATACKKILVLYAGEMMEFGDVKDVLKKSLHPYTQGLIASFPSLRGKKEKIQSIPGSLPNLAIQSPGCIFADRCKKCMSICRLKKPELVHVGAQDVRCHLYDPFNC